MNFFKKAIFGLMAVAISAGFTACSDDDDYEVGSAQPGAYFAADASKTVGVPNGATEFTLDLFRTEGAPGLYELKVNDPQGMFEVPSQVSFNGSAMSTTITVKILKPMAEETNYPLSIDIVDGSAYGLTQYSFNVRILRTVVTGKVGTGTYIFNGIYSGGMRGVPVTFWTTKEAPEFVKWTIGNPSNAQQMLAGTYYYEITFANYEPNEDGVIPFRIEPQFVMENNGDRIMIADCQTFYELNGFNGSRFEDDSYFDPETGLLTIHAAYYIDGTTRWYGDNFEYMQLDGYPDYTVSVEYKGLYIDPQMTTQAIGVFTTGDDVAKVHAAAVKTNDPEVALDYILEGGADVVEFDGGTEVTQLLPTDGAGVYYLMAVTYDAKGEAMELDYTQFEILASGGEDDSENWKDLGTADFCDGWITAAFARGGVPIVAADEMFPVPIQQHKDDPTLFRMVEPWGSNYPIASLNAYPAKRNIQFVIDGPEYVAIEPQMSGFGTADWHSEMQVGELTGAVQANNPDASHSAVTNYIKSKNPQFLSTYEDGIVSIPLPQFGFPDDPSDNKFGYNWKNYQASALYMPEVPASVKKLNKAKRVAAPSVQGLRASFQAVRTVDLKMTRIPVEWTPGTKSISSRKLRK